MIGCIENDTGVAVDLEISLRNRAVSPRSSELPALGFASHHDMRGVDGKRNSVVG
jgi:hypothetical protein